MKSSFICNIAYNHINSQHYLLWHTVYILHSYSLHVFSKCSALFLFVRTSILQQAILSSLLCWGNCVKTYLRGRSVMQENADGDMSGEQSWEEVCWPRALSQVSRVVGRLIRTAVVSVVLTLLWPCSCNIIINNLRLEHALILSD